MNLNANLKTLAAEVLLLRDHLQARGVSMPPMPLHVGGRMLSAQDGYRLMVHHAELKAIDGGADAVAAITAAGGPVRALAGEDESTVAMRYASARADLISQRLIERGIIPPAGKSACSIEGYQAEIAACAALLRTAPAPLADADIAAAIQGLALKTYSALKTESERAEYRRTHAAALGLDHAEPAPAPVPTPAKATGAKAGAVAWTPAQAMAAYNAIHPDDAKGRQAFRNQHGRILGLRK